MRRGLTAFLFLALLGGSAFAQGPYPYAPPVYGPMPYAPQAYGPMPYAPPPMMMPRPYYPPQPMWQPPPPAAPRPTVYVYGPLTAPQPISPVASQTTGEEAPKSKSNGVTEDSTPQAPLDPTGTRGLHYDIEGCGPQGCGPDGEPHRIPPVRGHGRFIGEVGAYFLVPYYGNRQAFSTTVGTTSTATNFSREIDAGPRASIGYLFHSGFGFRANYWYFHGDANESISNGNAGAAISTPLLAPFQALSPSAALTQGLGADRMAFTQSVDVHVVDAEMLKECPVLDTTFLLSFGARYARVVQSYSATRTNGGDFEAIHSNSRFAGWGPTTSLELIHRLGGSNLAVYASGRGSFLFGVDRFEQGRQGQGFVDYGYESQTRCATIVEAELGLQYGCSLGHGFAFIRVGGVYQRWFDVGSPVGSNGDLTFAGGTVRLGIVY